MGNTSYISYILSFAEGLLTFVSPCILPMLPVYFFYLAGVSTGEESLAYADAAVPEGAAGRNKSRLAVNSIGFVIGFTVVFVLLGATATSFGHFLKSHLDIFRKISGIIMVVFGLNFIGILKIGFLNVEKRIEYEVENLNIVKSAIFGITFGFAWTPCLTAFLGSVLLMAGSSGTITQGIVMLLIFSAGLGVPFIFTALVFDKAKDIFMRIRRYNRIINMVSGIVLILAGILAYTDNLKYLNTIFQ